LKTVAVIQDLATVRRILDHDGLNDAPPPPRSRVRSATGPLFDPD